MVGPTAAAGPPAYLHHVFADALKVIDVHSVVAGMASDRRHDQRTAVSGFGALGLGGGGQSGQTLRNVFLGSLAGAVHHLTRKENIINYSIKICLACE